MNNIDEYISYRDAIMYCSECTKTCNSECDIIKRAQERYEATRSQYMKASEAALRAQKKYDTSHKDDYKTYNLKFSKKADAEIIFRLDTVPNKIDYIRELIKKDIEGGK